MSIRASMIGDLVNNAGSMLDSAYDFASTAVTYAGQEKQRQENRDLRFKSNQDVLKTQYTDGLRGMLEGLPESIDFDKYGERVQEYNEEFISTAQGSGSYDERTLSWLENEFIPSQRAQTEKAVEGVSDYAAYVWVANNANNKANAIAADPSLNVDDAYEQYRTYYSEVGLGSIPNGKTVYGYLDPEEFKEAIRGTKALQAFEADARQGFGYDVSWDKAEAIERAKKAAGYSTDARQGLEFRQQCESKLAEIQSDIKTAVSEEQVRFSTDINDSVSQGLFYNTADLVQTASTYPAAFTGPLIELLADANSSNDILVYNDLFIEEGLEVTDETLSYLSSGSKYRYDVIERDLRSQVFGMFGEGTTEEEAKEWVLSGELGYTASVLEREKAAEKVADWRKDYEAGLQADVPAGYPSQDNQAAYDRIYRMKYIDNLPDEVIAKELRLAQAQGLLTMDTVKEFSKTWALAQNEGWSRLVSDIKAVSADFYKSGSKDDNSLNQGQMEIWLTDMMMQAVVNNPDALDDPKTYNLLRTLANEKSAENFVKNLQAYTNYNDDTDGAVKSLEKASKKNALQMLSNGTLSFLVDFGLQSDYAANADPNFQGDADRMRDWFAFNLGYGSQIEGAYDAVKKMPNSDVVLSQIEANVAYARLRGDVRSFYTQTIGQVQDTSDMVMQYIETDALGATFAFRDSKDSGLWILPDLDGLNVKTMGTSDTLYSGSETSWYYMRDTNGDGKPDGDIYSFEQLSQAGLEVYNASVKSSKTEDALDSGTENGGGLVDALAERTSQQLAVPGEPAGQTGVLGFISWLKNAFSGNKRKKAEKNAQKADEKKGLLEGLLDLIREKKD